MSVGQTMEWAHAACYVFLFFPINNMLCSILAAVMLPTFIPALRVPMLLYLAFIYFDRSPTYGGYNFCWWTGLTRLLRHGFWWKASAAYYPLKLHKTGPLHGDKGPYLFVNHPHGVIGVGTMATFGSEANGFSKLFPDLQPLHLLGLNKIFQIPFFREWVILQGHATPGKKTMLRLLNAKHNLALNTGGAREALDAHPGTFRLYLKNRKGFVKVALKTGASLVPCLHFGENELYHQVKNKPGTWLRSVQEKFRSIFGFSLPLFFGNPLFPVLPKPAPVNSVIGSPIFTEKLETVTDKDIDLFHERYIIAVCDLFEKHKKKFGFDNVPIEIY